MFTVRASEEGVDALNSDDQREFSLYADEDNVLIKEKERGSGTVAYLSDATIPHDLNYIPFYMVYALVNTGRYRIANAFDPVGSGWRVYSDDTNLYIQNRYSASYEDYTYYIFYDDIT